MLTAVEAVTYLDAGFWHHFGDPDVADKVMGSAGTGSEATPNTAKGGEVPPADDPARRFPRRVHALNGRTHG